MVIGHVITGLICQRAASLALAAVRPTATSNLLQAWRREVDMPVVMLKGGCELAVFPIYGENGVMHGSRSAA